MSFGSIPCPASLKLIQYFLKIAQEHEGRDPVVAYWCRLYALQVGLKLSTQQPDESNFLKAIMNWLETAKKQNTDNESITNQVAAQAYLENYALKLFLYADHQDRESNFGKNVVKAFYTSGIIYDVLQTFGELTEEAAQNRKYAKWKATYIHNCLKNGEVPVAGPMQTEDGEEMRPAPSGEFLEISGDGVSNGGPSSLVEQQHSQPQPEPSSQPQTPVFPGSSFDADQPPPQSTLTADQVLQNPDILPKPPVDEERNPGGFIPFVPQSNTTMFRKDYVSPPADVQLSFEIMFAAQKYCKYAASALNFDDSSTAIENIQKALKLLTRGKE